MGLSKEEGIKLAAIRVPSENDPSKPEFPPGNPKFPATSVRKIKVPGFTNVWLKDESINPTGTHKDRMAWEVVVTYKDFLTAKKRGQTKSALPHLSVITSGSAGLAIQTQLKKFELPNLKVLIDTDLDSSIRDKLKKAGCEIYETDLSRKAFTWNEILALTHNPRGIDITSADALDPHTRFYDWLAYEIINISPDYCFIPFGTGNLYENVIGINKKEVSTKDHDPRFKGKVETLRRCNFMGATTNNPKSKADKLYSPHLPFIHYDEQSLRLYKFAGYCGTESDVYPIKEVYLDQAMEIAKSQGINCEFSGIAGLALILQLKRQLPKNKKMLIINTGNSMAAKNSLYSRSNQPF
jgi:hypothetical protein